MPTNPIGKGTKIVNVNMQKEMAVDLERRAADLKISTGSYIKLILKQWADSGQELPLSE